MEVQGDNITEGTKEPGGQAPEGQQSQAKQSLDAGQKDYEWTDEQRSYIEDLRKENAKYRTRAKERDSEVNVLNERLNKFETGLKKIFGDEADEMSPEERIEALQMQNEQLAVQSALKEAAFEYGVDRDNYEYFEFLVSKRLASLEEGEELSEEDLDEIAVQAKGRGGFANTSVGNDGRTVPEPEVDDGGISLEKFETMGISEKSVLYQKNPQLYNQLAAQSRAANKKR